MQRLIRKSRFLAYLLIALFLGEAAPLAALAQQDPPKIENVRLQINGRSSVYIDYDLLAPTEQVFKVSITMRSKTDSTFSYVPQNVAGDVGDNVFPGRNNRIVWSIAKEYPEGIREGEYYFVFSVELDQETSTGAGTTLIVAGGAALVGGIVALIVISKKSSTGPGSGSAGFPQPPSRP
jgi:hypothetical protein